MQRVWMMVLATALGAPASAWAQDATVQAAARAMGATNLNTIRYAGTGSTYGFQQAPVPGGPWPRFDANTYNVTIDYNAPAMRLETARSQGEHPPRGGSGQPMAGQQRSVQVVNGKFAWGENPAGAASPNAGASSERLQDLWMTPHGLIKAALASGAKASGKVIPLTIEGQAVKVTLNNANLVDRVEYMIANPVLGDMPIDITYSDYQDHGGTKFPRRIVERWSGYPILDITVNKVEPNVAVSLAVPANVQNAPARPAPAAAPAEDAQKIADGVWYLAGGNPRSVAVEFSDHVVVVEGPSNDARSVAVQQWVRTNIPGKPIRYLVNTHHHFDHSGGLRGYAAAGIPIITHALNKTFYDTAYARPHTISPDLLAKSGKKAVFETITDKRVLTDGTRTMELHHIRGHGHAPGYIMAYLPREKILIYADSYNPPAGEDPRDAGRTNEFLQDLYNTITDRLKLDVVTLAPLHGRIVPFDNMKKALGLLPYP
jgi:glyoxylase-like metal-dependent hydrolase (beta-lactamase superfamily II)